MSANPKCYETSNQVSFGGTNHSGPSDSMQKITVGPAALAQVLIYQIMALYAEVIELDQKQKESSLETQKAEAVAQANATKDGGSAIGTAMIAAGVCTIVSGVGALIAGSLANRGDGALESQQEDIIKQMKPMEQFEDMAKELEPAEEVLGPNVRGGGSIAKLEEEFGQGRFGGIEDADAENAIRQMKAKPESNFEEVRRANQQKLDRLSRNRNSVVNQRQTNSQHGQRISQLVSNTAQGVGTGISGGGQAQKALHDSQASLYNTATTQAGMNVNDSGKGADKAYDAQNAEVKILEQIHATNNVRG